MKLSPREERELGCDPLAARSACASGTRIIPFSRITGLLFDGPGRSARVRLAEFIVGFVVLPEELGRVFRLWVLFGGEDWDRCLCDCICDVEVCWMILEICKWEFRDDFGFGDEDWCSWRGCKG